MKKKHYNALEMTGYVAKEPRWFETRYGAMVRFTVGRDVSRRSDADKPAKKEFFDVLVFGRALESLPELAKGNDVTVRGQLRQRTWTDRNTEKRHFEINVVAHEVCTGIRERSIDLKDAELAQAHAEISALEATVKEMSRDYDEHVNGRHASSGLRSRAPTLAHGRNGSSSRNGSQEIERTLEH